MSVDAKELCDQTYGPSTAAVLANKKKRAIINPAYQFQADNTVGKMTIANLDQDAARIEQRRADRHLPPQESFT